MHDDAAFQHTLEQLRRELDDPESGENLARLALVVACAEYPDLDIGAEEERIDRLAAAAVTQYARAGNARASLRAINRVLFQQERLEGNTEDYYDPANSYLNQVLRRRLGIPISLSILYMAVAERVGVAAHGIALPLHFMVRCAAENAEVIVDPFHAGALRTRKECEELVRGLAGAPIALTDESFAHVPARQVIYRMLNNLKIAYYRRGDVARTGRTVDLMLAVGNDPPLELRDRGLLLIQEGQSTRGAEFLARYLRDSPEAPDAELVRRQIDQAFTARAARN